MLQTRIRTQGIAPTGQALANAARSAKEIPGPVITYLLHPDPTWCNARVFFPRPPRPRKAAAALLTDRETKDPEAERLSQGHSVNSKPDQPPLPTENHSTVPVPGGACAVTREPVLRPADRSSRGRGDRAEGLASDSARRDSPSCPTRTHPPLPARNANASKARARTAPPLPPAPGTENSTGVRRSPEVFLPEVTHEGGP